MLRVDEWRLKVSAVGAQALEKLQGTADGLSQKFVGVQDNLNKLGDKKGAGNMLGGLGTKMQELVGSGSKLGAVMPGVGSAIGALASPVGIAVAAVALLTLGFSKAVAASEQFAPAFRELRNLNLDKSDAEIDDLKNRVLGISFDKGFDPSKFAKGYFDIQSAVGSYGRDAEDVLSRVGEVSRATGADFNENVKAISKSMIAFKMGASQVDEILISNAKTVQTGIVTYDELAKVQTEYVGAAASANQTLDTSNKLMVLFTKNTKNADISATMLKTLFQDIGKKDTVDTLKKIGVNVFDAKGNMRQMDAVLKDLVPKLGTMTDLTFSQMKEEIGGSEGLRGLLDQAKASGDDVLRTLAQYDGTKLDINKMLSQANGDLDVMSEKVSNKLTNAWTMLGEKFKPVALFLKQALIVALDVAVAIGSVIGPIFGALATGLGYAWRVFTAPLKTLYTLITDGPKAAFAYIENGITRVAEKITGTVGKAWNWVKNLVGLGDDKPLVTPAGAPDMKKGSPAEAMAAAQKKATPPGAADAMAAPQQKKVTPPGAPEVAPPSNPYADAFAPKEKGAGKSDGVSKGVDAVVGGGTQVRNVTITIQKMVERIDIRTASAKDTPTDWKRQMEEALISVVRGGEAALANG